MNCVKMDNYDDDDDINIGLVLSSLSPSTVNNYGANYGGHRLDVSLIATSMTDFHYSHDSVPFSKKSCTVIRNTLILLKY